MTDYEKETGMTIEGHKNRVLLKVLVGGLIIGGLLYVLKKQNK